MSGVVFTLMILLYFSLDQLKNGKVIVENYKPHINDICIFVNNIEDCEKLFNALVSLNVMKIKDRKPEHFLYNVYIPRYDMINSHLYVEMWCPEEIERNKIGVTEFLIKYRSNDENAN